MTSSPSDVPTIIPSLTPVSSIPSSAPSMAGWVASVDATASVTTSIDASVIAEYEAAIAGYYGVSSDSISSTTTYSTGGSFVMAIPDDTSEEVIVNAVVVSVSAAIGAHPSDVDVVVDMESGLIEFTVNSESYSEAAEAKFDLENDGYQYAIVADIVGSVPDSSVESITISDVIEAEIEYTIDADDATQDRTQAAFRTEELLSDFDVEVKNVYITHAPTLVPSLSPSTSVPSASPSITGAVAVIELSRVVNESLSEDDVSNITSEIADAFGVNEGAVTVEVIYETTGSFNITLTTDVAEEEVEEAMEEAISNILGIHESAVNVEIENGSATYTIVSSSVEEAHVIVDTMGSANISSTIDNAIEDVDVSSGEVDEDVTVDVIVTVDTSDASEPLTDAADHVEDVFEDYGYNTTAQSMSSFIHKFWRDNTNV